jgi:hypothetical protein
MDPQAEEPIAPSLDQTPATPNVTPDSPPAPVSREPPADWDAGPLGQETQYRDGMTAHIATPASHVTEAVPPDAPARDPDAS